MTQPRWRRMEPDERREQILASAVRLFGDRPYAAVSTTELAADAGVARGLINHYFGTKRELYLEVVRALVTFPELKVKRLPEGTLDSRVEVAISWFLDDISAHGSTWLRVLGAEGIGQDPEVERILAQADDDMADRVLDAVGLAAEVEHREELRAMIRAYSGLVKTASREWLNGKTLTREQVQTLLTTTLLAIVRDAFPAVRGT